MTQIGYYIQTPARDPRSYIIAPEPPAFGHAASSQDVIPPNVEKVYFKFGDTTPRDVEDPLLVQQDLLRASYFTHNPDFGNIVFIWNDITERPLSTGIGKAIETKIRENITLFDFTVYPNNFLTGQNRSEWFVSTSVQSVFALGSELKRQATPEESIIVVRNHAEFDALVSRIIWSLIPTPTFPLV